MTKSTDSRNIRLMVNSILVSYGIDDFAMESNLSSGLLRYLQERMKNKGRDKAAIREEILADLRISEKNVSQKETMQVRVKAAIGINASGDRFTSMIDFLVDEEKNGNTIERFKEWWDKQNEFKRPALWKISDRPALLHELWPSMTEEKPVQELDQSWKNEDWRNVEIG